MKTWIDEVKEQLKSAWDFLDDMVIIRDDECEILMSKLEQALRLIPEEDPMVVLLSELERKREIATSAWAIAPTLDRQKIWQGHLEAIGTAIEYIESMGYKLEEE